MPRKKMIPPLPDALGESEHDRFKKFAQAILAVPKSEVDTPEHHGRYVSTNLPIKHEKMLVETLTGEPIRHPERPSLKRKAVKKRER